MNAWFRWTCCVLVLLAASCATPRAGGPDRPVAAPSRPAGGDFVLGPGDEVNVKVWRHDDLNRTVRIDPIGDVDLPLVGPIHAQGLTLVQLKEAFTARLGAKYLVNPQVDMSVGEIRSRKVFVLGEVRSPGGFTLDPRMSAWEAVAMAGGFTADANRTRVLLVRAENAVATATVVSFDDWLSGGSGSPPAPLLRDRDVIYVCPGKIPSVERFMIRLSNILSPILSLESAVILTHEAADVLNGNSSSSSTSVIVPK